MHITYSLLTEILYVQNVLIIPVCTIVNQWVEITTNSIKDSACQMKNGGGGQTIYVMLRHICVTTVGMEQNKPNQTTPKLYSSLRSTQVTLTPMCKSLQVF